jgi:hypothetical protein
MALDAERELTQWTAGIDVRKTFVATNRTPPIDAKRTGGSDVKHPLRIAALDASIGR